jgi:hypothetical protein
LGIAHQRPEQDENRRKIGREVRLTPATSPDTCRVVTGQMPTRGHPRVTRDRGDLADQRAQPFEIIGHDASLCRDRFPCHTAPLIKPRKPFRQADQLSCSEASEYLVAQPSTTKNPYPYLGRATQYRFASFKRSTWSGERSN